MVVTGFFLHSVCSWAAMGHDHVHEAELQREGMHGH